VTVVGWGETTGDSADYGTKRDGLARVTAVDTLTFQVAPDPSQPCAGDSGGPAFVTTGGVESVVGITSHGDVGCSEMATFTRVDAVTAEFISPTLTALGPGTVSVGERCLYAEQCAGGASACVTAPDEPALTYCTEGCSVNADCPSEMICVSVANLGSQCRYPVPTPGAYGSACASDADCEEGECTSMGTCALPCFPDGATCPTGLACTNTDGVDFFCLGSPPTITGGGCTFAPSGRSAPLTWLAVAALALGVVCGRAGRRRSELRAG
jgi:hypothetical protein